MVPPGTRHFAERLPAAFLNMSDQQIPSIHPDDPKSSEFETHAAGTQSSVWRDFREFLIHNKRWWLIPLIVSLLLVGTLIVATSNVIIPGFYIFF